MKEWLGGLDWVTVAVALAVALFLLLGVVYLVLFLAGLAH